MSTKPYRVVLNYSSSSYDCKGDGVKSVTIVVRDVSQVCAIHAAQKALESLNLGEPRTVSAEIA